MSKLDRLFGGKPGSAEKARQQMHKTYGSQKGQTVFEATVHKRELREKRRAKR